MPKKKPDGSEEPKKVKKRKRTSVVVGHREDGSAVRKYPSASSGAKLAKKVDELKRVHGAGGPGDLADILFQDYAKRWLDGKEGEVALNTIRGYRLAVKNHINPYIGQMQVRSILQSDVKILLGKMKGNAANTRSQVIGVVKAIFNMAVDDHIRFDNPSWSIKRTKDVEPKRRALTEKEGEAAEKYIREHPATEEAKLIALLYYNGTRKGETFGLQWKHLDFKNRKIKIEQQLTYGNGHGGEISPKLKRRNSYREIPMQEELYQFLLPLRGTSEAYVFHKGGKHYKYWEAGKLAEMIPVVCPTLSGVTPHYFRHNYATRLYLAGVPVKEAAQIFGDTVEEMLKTYAHIEKSLTLTQDSRAYGIFSRVAKSLPSSST